MPTPPCIKPLWPAPDNVEAFSTLRTGGVSAPPFDTLNLAFHVGDAEAAVTENRGRLQELLPQGSRISYLNQVHGIDVVEAKDWPQEPEADALWSRTPGLACAVMTADCLPILFCTKSGDAVAAAHAGWRGLAQGVVEATVNGMQAEPQLILAWLGPAIGPSVFEVGNDVRESFIDRAHSEDLPATQACFLPKEFKPGHFLADIFALARVRLRRAGVTAIYGGGECTYSNTDQFFSFRREGTTGRLASVITLC